MALKYASKIGVNRPTSLAFAIPNWGPILQQKVGRTEKTVEFLPTCGGWWTCADVDFESCKKNGNELCPVPCNPVTMDHGLHSYVEFTRGFDPQDVVGLVDSTSDSTNGFPWQVGKPAQHRELHKSFCSCGFLSSEKTCAGVVSPNNCWFRD